MALRIIMKSQNIQPIIGINKQYQNEPLLYFVLFLNMQIKQKQTPKITVAIRKRPLNKKEAQKGQTDIVRIQGPGTVVISQYKQKVDLTKYIEETTFNFDHSYDENTSNEQIYYQCIQPLIQSAFRGAKISCFAYGQTGSGKTYTMKGDIEKGVPGLYYLGAKQIFQYLNHPDFRNFTVNVSFYEIYCGRLHDLLNNRNQLKIREDKKQNINVIGMEEKKISSAEQFLQLIQYGSKFRVTSENATNADSSRSHAILQISLKDGKKLFTKISFIDLAGNERGADHIDQNKQTKIDGAQINKSLLALKQCIRALDQGKGHTPFRGSKLTMVLKDSFVGFCKTVMIGNVSPNVFSCENTMNTLRYADRVKELKNQNQAPLTKEELAARQMMLPRAYNKNCLKVDINPNDDDEEIEIKKQLARKNQRSNRRPDWNTEAEVQQNYRRQNIVQKQTNTRSRNDDRKSMAPKTYHSENINENQLKQRNLPAKSVKEIKHIEIKKYNHLQSSENNGSYWNGASKNKNTPMKDQFISHHYQTIKQEGQLLKEEGQMLEKINRFNSIDAMTYLQSMQKNITKKMAMLESLRKRADTWMSSLQQENNKAHESSLGDEQLLEGLALEEGGKLF